MANTTQEKVKVKGLSKYGFFVEGKDKGLYYSKQFKDQAKVIPGVEFDVELYTSDAGSVYLNKILSQSVTAQVAAEPPTTTPVVTSALTGVDTERAKKFTPKFEKKSEAISAGLSKEEWAAKDQRISRQGVIQAAVIALAPVVSLETLPQEAAKLATSMLHFVNQPYSVVPE